MCAKHLTGITDKWQFLLAVGLAVVLFRLHQYQGAQDLYARAYDILSSKLGPEDKEVATTMNNTAGLLKAMGKLADAEVVYRTVSTHCAGAVCANMFTSCPSLAQAGLEPRAENRKFPRADRQQ